MPTLIYDYHCHTTASDGELSPTALVTLAAKEGVQSLAITDHDTVSAYEEALPVAQSLGVELISGIELSVKWHKVELHLVGLGMDLTAPEFQALVQQQKAARRERAKKMGERLDKATGLKGTYEGVCQLAGSQTPGRPHFAQWLVQQGQVRDIEHAFNRFLKAGQSGYVSTPWVSMFEALEVIQQSGGVSVIAHPTRYRLTRMKLRRLLTEFCEHGGQGLEVALPRLNAQQEALLYECMEDFPLVASGGSDFHSPKQEWLTLGKIPPLKEGTPFVRSHIEPLRNNIREANHV